MPALVSTIPRPTPKKAEMIFAHRGKHSRNAISPRELHSEESIMKISICKKKQNYNLQAFFEDSFYAEAQFLADVSDIRLLASGSAIRNLSKVALAVS
jgi:hypothetical protein